MQVWLGCIQRKWKEIAEYKINDKGSTDGIFDP